MRYRVAVAAVGFRVECSCLSGVWFPVYVAADQIGAQLVMAYLSAQQPTGGGANDHARAGDA